MEISSQPRVSRYPVPTPGTYLPRCSHVCYHRPCPLASHASFVVHGLWMFSRCQAVNLGYSLVCERQCIVSLTSELRSAGMAVVPFSHTATIQPPPRCMHPPTQPPLLSVPLACTFCCAVVARTTLSGSAFVESPTCFECQTSFGLFTRRHHCRGCGQSFCSNHSAWKIATPQGEDRACKNCYVQSVSKGLQAKPASGGGGATASAGAAVGAGGAGGAAAAVTAPVVPVFVSETPGPCRRCCACACCEDLHAMWSVVHPRAASGGQGGLRGLCRPLHTHALTVTHFCSSCRPCSCFLVL